MDSNMRHRKLWRPIAGYDNMYWVSNCGEVKSYRYWPQRGKESKGRAFLLKPTPTPDGHLYVHLFKEGITRTISLGKLVLTAFRGPPVDERIWTCHNDGDPTNNYLTNLRWDTNSGNQMDRVIHGTSNLGSSNGNSKLTENDVHEIRRRLALGHKQAHIARDYEIDASAISNISRKRNWAYLPDLV